MAVRAFRDEQVSRIILTCPAVEAGEKLGFLPGDLQDKADPHLLRPLYDAMFDMMGPENFQRDVEKGCIEVQHRFAPHARRSLDDDIILMRRRTPRRTDEDVLTRLGFNPKRL